MKGKENTISDWLKSDWVAIIATLLPAALSLAGIVYDSLGQHVTFNWSFISFMQAVFVLISLFFILSNRGEILNKLNHSEDRLKSYFQKEYRLNANDPYSAGSAMTVLRNTVQQFYFCWLVFWGMWLLFYGWNFVEAVIRHSEIDDFVECRYRYGVECVFDFMTSSILFLLYLILNNVTAERRLRAETHPADIRIGVVFLLVVSCVISTLFIHSLMMDEQDKTLVFMLSVKLLLGCFSTFTFVLFLGKLNSFYLQIPMLLNLFVYVYAVLQVFNPISLLIAIPDDSGLKKGLETLFANGIGDWRQFGENANIMFHVLTLLGKVSLALILYWIVYKYRFVYFVITKSMSLTETPEKIKIWA